MKLETVVTKTLKITLEEPVKTWFSTFAWGDDKYEYEKLPDDMMIDKWKHFVWYLEQYLLDWPMENVELWNDEFSHYRVDMFNNQVKEIVGVDVTGFDRVMI